MIQVKIYFDYSKSIKLICKYMFLLLIDLDQINGGTINSNVQNSSNTLTNNSNLIGTNVNTHLTNNNKLPLFDYYSFNLRTLPTSSYI